MCNHNQTQSVHTTHPIYTGWRGGPLRSSSNGKHTRDAAPERSRLLLLFVLLRPITTPTCVLPASLQLQQQATPLVAGVGVAAAAFIGREAVKQWIKFKAAPAAARAYYKGGFQPEMNRREAALILGLRETAAEERIKEAHRRIMIANHPDSGVFLFCGEGWWGVCACVQQLAAVLMRCLVWVWS